MTGRHKEPKAGWRMHLLAAKALAAAAGSWTLLFCASTVFSPVLVLLTPPIYWALELGFALHTLLKWKRLSAEKAAFTQPSRKDAWLCFESTLEVLEAHHDPASWIVEWFKGAPIDTIYKDNVCDLLAHAVWHESRATLVAKGYGDDLELMLASLERLVGASFAPGHNPRVRFYAHTQERLPHFYRPLSVYAGFEFIAWMHHNMLRAVGYKRMVLPAVCGAASSSNGAHSTNNDISTSGTDALVATHKQHLGQDGANPRRGCAGSCGAQPGSSGAVYFITNVPQPGPSCSKQKAALQTGNHSCLPHMDSSSGSCTSGSITASTHGLCAGHAVSHTLAVEWVSAAAGPAGSDDDDDADLMPIVFLHGVGMGLLPYFRLLMVLAASGRPVIAIECAHVSQRWCTTAPRLECMAAEVRAILARHGYSRASFIAHSFGSAVCSVLLRQDKEDQERQQAALRNAMTPQPQQPQQPQLSPERPASTLDNSTQRNSSAGGSGAIGEANTNTSSGAVSGVVAQLALVDPICFHMFVPRLLKNFLYRRLSVRGLLMDLAVLGPAREMHCTAVLCRQLQWSRVNMWHDDLPEGTVVLLSEHDELVCVQQVAAWLRQRTQAVVHVMPGMAHAQFCLSGHWQDWLVSEVLQRTYGLQQQQQQPQQAQVADLPAGSSPYSSTTTSASATSPQTCNAPSQEAAPGRAAKGGVVVVAESVGGCSLERQGAGAGSGRRLGAKACSSNRYGHKLQGHAGVQVVKDGCRGFCIGDVVEASVQGLAAATTATSACAGAACACAEVEATTGQQLGNPRATLLHTAGGIAVAGTPSRHDSASSQLDLAAQPKLLCTPDTSATSDGSAALVQV